MVSLTLMSEVLTHLDADTMAQGRAARFADLELPANPYATTDRRCRLWQLGWNTCDDELVETKRKQAQALVNAKVFP